MKCDTHLSVANFDFPLPHRSSWSSDPYSEVVSWFPVHFPVSNCLWIPETFAVWSSPGFVSTLQ